MCATCGERTRLPNSPRCEVCQTRHKADHNVTLERRRAAGVCVDCGTRPPDAGSVRCSLCRDIRAARARAHRGDTTTDVRLAQGLCRDCGGPLDEGFLRCAACRSVENFKKAQRTRASEPPRPKTRGDCEDGVRPCPYLSCCYHVRSGEQATAAELAAMPETCVLDVADRDGASREECATILGLTEDEVAQIERDTMQGIAQRHPHLRLLLPPEAT